MRLGGEDAGQQDLRGILITTITTIVTLKYFVIHLRVELITMPLLDCM